MNDKDLFEGEELDLFDWDADKPKKKEPEQAKGTIAPPVEFSNTGANNNATDIFADSPVKQDTVMRKEQGSPMPDLSTSSDSADDTPIIQTDLVPKAEKCKVKQAKGKKSKHSSDSFDINNIEEENPLDDVPVKKMTASSWIGTIIVSCIPIIGFIMILIWGLGKSKSERKPWAQAQLILLSVVFVFSFGVFATLGTTGLQMLKSFIH